MFWILVLFGFVAGCIGCATYGAKGVMPNFSSVDKTSLSQKIGDGLLVVSGYAFTNDKDIDKYFDEDLYKHDILPIFVEIQNNAASDVKLVAAVLNLDGASSITPMSQEGVYAVIKRGWAGRSTFWWFFGLYVGAPISAYATHKTNLHIQQDLDEKILKFGEIGKGTTRGFICFEIPKAANTGNAALFSKGILKLKLIFEKETKLIEYDLDVYR